MLEGNRGDAEEPRYSRRADPHQSTDNERWRLLPVASRLPEYHLDGRINAMRVSIDGAGRIIVPKPLREALGIKPGQLLEIRAGDGRLEIEIAPTAMRLEKRGRGLVAVPDEELPALTADQVRETLERTRR